ncbi:guanylate-binding protein 3-like [Rhodamnia argentea]|uniref:Guanylate-binding protein 3-like n=1 Tax=Rhodamnia argentea TaxID=178133 RepID=A0A8B8MNR4_9MYRT|nr:guanylate-binding protein 3-like [Rhodamnia argentea]
MIGATKDASAPSPSSSPASVTGAAWPICFLLCDGQGKPKMDPRAAEVIRLVKTPIAVLFGWGRARKESSSTLMPPLTKGLWLMSAPMKRSAVDGTEYTILHLDSDGTVGYDQKIFSLAVLLSSVFVYNQFGGIDAAALHQLSVLTQTTEPIRVIGSNSGLGQYTPTFVWLLKDFSFDLLGDNKSMTPQDYLELALRPIQGTGSDIAAKNEIRESIRALFPDRHCFTLVRPLNTADDQLLNQILMDKLSPELWSGLETLREFVFERTRPKQVGDTILTGPVLVALAESCLEALDRGVVPTVPSSWKTVEEKECRIAYDRATKVYMSSLYRSDPLEQAGMSLAHEEAKQKSLAAFNASAVGAGSARKRHEGCLHKFFRKAFEEGKMNAFMEADSRCSLAIQSMENKLRAACHTPDADVFTVGEVLNDLLSEYEASSHGPSKWQKLAVFLRESWEGPIHDLANRAVEQVRPRRSSSMQTCREIEDHLGLLKEQLEASENEKSQYLKQQKDGISDKNKLDTQIISLKEKIRESSKTLEEANVVARSLQTRESKLDKVIRDGLSVPLIKDLAARGVWPVPTRFSYLPETVKLHILKWLPATDLASIACVNKGLRTLASDNSLWKLKFEDKFGVWSPGNEVDWQQSFRRTMKKQKEDPSDGFDAVLVEMKDPPGNGA